MANPNIGKDKPGEVSSRPIADRRRKISTRVETDTPSTSPAVSPTKPADDEGRIATIIQPSDGPISEPSDEKTNLTEDPQTIVEPGKPTAGTTSLEQKPENPSKKSLEQIEKEVAASTASTGKLDTPAPADREPRSSGNSSTKASAAIPPPKTMEQVEEEIRRATMESDESVKKNGRKRPSSSKDGKVVPAAAMLKVKPMAIDPSNIMRFVRVIMIVLLASFTGYRTVENSRLEAIKIKAQESIMVRCFFEC